MTIVWMWAVSVILETFLLCRPLAYNWDTSIAGTCGNRNATYVVAGTLNLVTDLMVMALPVPHIWKLQLSFSKKIALSGVFSVGLLWVTCIPLSATAPVAATTIPFNRDDISLNYLQGLNYQHHSSQIVDGDWLLRHHIFSSDGSYVDNNRARACHHLRKYAFPENNLVKIGSWLILDWAHQAEYVRSANIWKTRGTAVEQHLSDESNGPPSSPHKHL